MRILGLETSCDETAAAIVEWTPSPSEADGGQVTVLAETVASQIELHAKWGGVVPNLAAREHARNIVPVIEATLGKAGLTPDDLDLIAVTQGPGLMPALLVGVTAAKTLALVWNKPLIGIHHLEGHIYANFVRENQMSETEYQKPIFPLIALIVSGGHTELVLLRDHFRYEVLGETGDDAAGEAFDKVARLLGLPYPGGPVVARRADAFDIRHSTFDVRFPRPMLHSDDYAFSFSGLKTAVLCFLKKHEAELKDERFIGAVCHEFQEAVVDVLVGKSRRALLEYRPRAFTIAGGVSANVRLRNRLRNCIGTEFPGTAFLVPEFAYSLDNAVMIGAAAAYRLATSLASDGGQPLASRLEALKKNALTLEPDAHLPLGG